MSFQISNTFRQDLVFLTAGSDLYAFRESSRNWLTSFLKKRSKFLKKRSKKTWRIEKIIYNAHIGCGNSSVGRA